MKVTKVRSGKATKYLCACVPMDLCAFQIEFDLELKMKNKANFNLDKISLSALLTSIYDMLQVWITRKKQSQFTNPQWIKISDCYYLTLLDNNR